MSINQSSPDSDDKKADSIAETVIEDTEETDVALNALGKEPLMLPILISLLKSLPHSFWLFIVHCSSCNCCRRAKNGGAKAVANSNAGGQVAANSTVAQGKGVSSQ